MTLTEHARALRVWTSRHRIHKVISTFISREHIIYKCTWNRIISSFISVKHLLMKLYYITITNQARHGGNHTRRRKTRNELEKCWQREYHRQPVFPQKLCPQWLIRNSRTTELGILRDTNNISILLTVIRKRNFEHS